MTTPQHYVFIKADPENLPKGEEGDDVSILWKGMHRALFWHLGEWNWSQLVEKVSKEDWPHIEFLTAVEESPEISLGGKSAEAFTIPAQGEGEQGKEPKKIV